MARYDTCKSATRRWPVAVFFNIILCACINAYIIYSKVTGKSFTKIEFLLQLIKKMCRDPSTKIDFSSLPTMVLKSSSQTLQKKKQCQLQLCKNKSSVSCHKCFKSCCGRHPTFTFINLLFLCSRKIMRNYYYNLICCNYQKCQLKILKVVVNIFSADY